MTFPFPYPFPTDPNLFGPAPTPSVLNPPQAQSPQPEQLSFGQRLQRLVSGPAAGGLSEQQNAEAARQAMVQAGLAALLASGRGEPTLAGLAMALSQGRQTGGAARQQIQMAQVRRQLADQAQNANMGQLMSFFSEAVAAGDMESAKLAVDLIKATQGKSGSGYDFRVINGHLVRVDPISGEAQDVLTVPPGPEANKFGQPQTLWDIEHGKPAQVFFDHNIGRYRDANDPTRIVAIDPYFTPRVGVEDKKTIAAALQLAMEDLNRYKTAPGIVSQFLSSNPLAGITRTLTSDDVQVFFAAKEQVQGLVTKLISGAQAAEAEVRRLSRGFVPQAGEGEVVVKRKLQVLNAWVDAIIANPNVDPWEAALKAEGRSPAEIARIMRERRRPETAAEGGPSPTGPTSGNRFQDLPNEGS